MPRLPINLPIREHRHGKETRRLEIFSSVSDVNTSSLFFFLFFLMRRSAEGACRKLEREWDPAGEETDVISTEAQNGPPRLWGRREGGSGFSPGSAGGGERGKA